MFLVHHWCAAIPIDLGVAVPQPVLDFMSTLNVSFFFCRICSAPCFLAAPLSTQQPVPSPAAATFNQDHLSKCCLKSHSWQEGARFSGFDDKGGNISLSTSCPNRPYRRTSLSSFVAAVLPPTQYSSKLLFGRLCFLLPPSFPASLPTTPQALFREVRFCWNSFQSNVEWEGEDVLSWKVLENARFLCSTSAVIHRALDLLGTSCSIFSCD